MHGDVTAFVILIFLFAAGAVVTALLFPRRQPAREQADPVSVSERRR